MSGIDELATSGQLKSSIGLAADAIYGSGLATGFIRLLTLHPLTSPEDQIRCTLAEVSLDRKPRYEALSYAWGLPKDERQILVNGRIVTVRENLYQALVHLRKDKDRFLWIDALCINQQNTLERNHQVKQMGRVYENAWRVLVWLGAEKDGSDEAMRCIASARSYLSIAPEISERFGPGSAHAILALLEREYWQRLWIIQELLLAKEARFQCGAQHICWEDLANLDTAMETNVSYFQAEDEYANPAMYDALPFRLMRLRRHYNGRRIPLWDLLSGFSASQCVDVRDKIYGLAGLTAELADLDIDYSKSTTTIYMDVIHLLRYSNTAAGRIVDISQRLQEHLNGQVTTPDPSSIFAAKLVVGSVGYNMGTITGFSALEYPGAQDMRHFRDVRRIAEATVMPIFSGISYGVHGGIRPGKYRDIENYQLHPKPWHYVHDSVWLKVSTPIKHIKPGEGSTQPQLFVTDTGEIGIAPGNAQATDIICGFFRTNVFAVLRWMSDRYIFVGRAALIQFPRDWDLTKGLDEDKVERLMCTQPSRKVTRWQRERPYISMALDMRTLQLLTR